MTTKMTNIKIPGNVLLLLLIFFLQWTNLHAQTEFWGTVSNGGAHGYGYIFRTNSTADNLEIKYHFDSVNGSNPGRLTLGSNGKIYGLTSSGGHFNMGVLYEYDMRTDSLVVLYHFNTTSTDLPYGAAYAHIGLTESAPGIFFGSVNAGRWVFKYNANTHTMQLAFMVPNFVDGSMSGTHFNSLSGHLFKAADGFLYGTTVAYSQCPTAAPNLGSVIRINPTTSTFSLVYPFNCNIYDGMAPNADFVEIGNKLYTTNQLGGAYGLSPTTPGNGCLFEYNRTANSYSNKHDFDGLNGFRPSSGLTLASNGKLYGTTAGGGTPYATYTNGTGVLFEFDPATGVYTKKIDFQHISGHPDTTIGIYPNGTPLISASNGKLYGQTIFGIFEYDIPTNEIRVAGRFPLISPAYPSLMEVCRPPSYAPFTDSVFTLCEGSFFRFDLHNSNATTVVWKHNGIVSAVHNSPVLEFDHITAADAGTWQCTMTNSCGVTKPFALHITVNAAAPGTVSSTLTPADTSMICPGTSITLSGNNGGTWNTGATTAGITVTQPGAYQVINVNSCGSFYSNIVVVDTIPSPPPVTIAFPNTYMCYGAPVVLTGNVPGGVWNTGETTSTLTVIADTVAEHYVTFTHACGTDTSNVIVLPGWAFYDQDPLPEITALGPLHFCAGSSVVLSSNKPSASSYYWVWTRVHAFGYETVGASADFTATEPGLYFVSYYSPCTGTVRSDTLEITVDVAAPPAPMVWYDGASTFCEGDSVKLETNGAGGSWSNGDTASFTYVHTTGVYFYASTNACGSTASATGLNVYVIPAPLVTWTQSPNNFCVSTPPVSLSGYSPTGGYFSGASVSGSTFNPATAGTGSHVIVYTYYDMTGCSATVTQTVQVEAAPVSPIIYNGLGPVTDSISICEGDSLLIFPVPVTYGLWNVGGTYPIMYAKDDGIYNFTVTNSCGTAVSNDFVLTVNASLPLTWATLPNNLCQNAEPINLGTPTPAGGTFSGPGVSGSSFDAHAAGTGVHTIHYVFDPPAGCGAAAQQEITVMANDSVYQYQTICQGQVYFFNGHTYNLQGIYTDTLQNAAGCDSIVVTDLTVDSPGITVLQDGPELTAQTAAAYQWMDCNMNTILLGETGQVFTADTNGNYAVIVTSAASCTDTSACYLVNDVGLQQLLAEHSFWFYPNPAAGELNIISDEKAKNISILDPAGKKVMSFSSSPADVSSLSRGTYILLVETISGTGRQRFIKL